MNFTKRFHSHSHPWKVEDIFLYVGLSFLSLSDNDSSKSWLSVCRFFSPCSFLQKSFNVSKNARWTQEITKCGAAKHVKKIVLSLIKIKIIGLEILPETKKRQTPWMHYVEGIWNKHLVESLLIKIFQPNSINNLA